MQVKTEPGAARSLTVRTDMAVREVLDGRRRGLRAMVPFIGPGVIASVAYMDPGNFAANIQAGSAYGYDLLWVVVAANLTAIMFQALSARIGIVTGRNLAELCRDEFSRPAAYAMWAVSEIAAMATDLAEFLGGAIGLALLFGIPLMWGMAATGAITYGILTFERSGYRPVEIIIGVLAATIGACYLVELAVSPPDWSQAALHSVVPHFADAGAVVLAAGITGATVMPHAIYLHSALTQARAPARDDRERRKLIRFSNIEVVLALTAAGAVNMAMVLTAASAFHAGHSDVAQIDTAYHTLVPLLGAAAATVFLVSLMASGLSSSAVGTMAGQIIMQGFVGFRIPLWVRRLLTMLPPFLVVAAGCDTTQALVMSQVALSIALPMPMISLLVLSARRTLMGDFAIGRMTLLAASAATALVVILNAFIILQAVGVSFP